MKKEYSTQSQLLQESVTTVDRTTPSETVHQVFSSAAVALLGRHSEHGYTVPAMPAILSEISRKGELDPQMLAEQVRDRARLLMIYEGLNAVNSVGTLGHFITRPAAAHTPVSEQKNNRAAHFINWLFNFPNGENAEFFSTQQLAALRESDPDTYEQVLRRVGYGIMWSLLEIEKNTGVPISELMTYMQTGATDPQLRESLGLSQGAASLPTLHVHSIAPGSSVQVETTTKPIDTMLKHFQSLDGIFMQFVGSDLAQYIEKLLPGVRVSVEHQQSNTDRSFSRYAGLRLSLPEQTSMPEALEYAVRIIGKLEPISQAALEYVGSGKDFAAAQVLQQNAKDAGFTAEAVQHLTEFLEILKPTARQLRDERAIHEAFVEYTQLLIRREAIEQQFLFTPDTRSDVELLSEYIHIIHELDRLRISKTQAEALGLEEAQINEYELTAKQQFTASDPLSVDVEFGDLREHSGTEVHVGEVFLHFPIIGPSGVIDLSKGYTLKR